MNENSMLFYRMVRNFLTVYLPEQKASSPNTVKAYRNALNLLIEYTKECSGTPMSEISFDTITREHMEGFLDWLEKANKCSVSTRNQRLSCIRSFYKYAGNRNITVMSCAQELGKIPVKKEAEVHELKYFSEDALKSILEQPDPRNKKEIRDLFFMILMYDTAARNQEILDIRLKDMHVSIPESYVVVTGKGRKTRMVPIMEKTVEHFKKYIRIFHKNSSGDAYLFYTLRNGEQCQMSPDNTGKFIKKYGELARKHNKEVPTNVHPHMFRHARAMHLYRGGMPLPLLSEWLGHAQLNTTLIYANADTRMKQEAIEKATSKINPLKSDKPIIDWEDDEDVIRKLYGLV